MRPGTQPAAQLKRGKDGRMVRCGQCGEVIGRARYGEPGVYVDVELIYGYSEQPGNEQVLYRMGDGAKREHARMTKRATRSDLIGEAERSDQQSARDRLTAGQAVSKDRAVNIGAADRAYRNPLGEETLRPQLAGFIAKPGSRFVAVVCAQCHTVNGATELA